MISQEKLLMDGKLHIFLLGSGGPMNNDKRVASSIAIIAEGEFLLFDVGPGSYRNVDVLRLPAGNLSAIFLTHFHSDHIGDLGEANMLSWVNGREKALEVYGPRGVEKVIKGFEIAYELDTGYRIAHHGTKILSREKSKMISKPIPIQNENERKLCFERTHLKVFAFAVDHSPINPAFGYRIEYKGNVIAITGDTIKTENLATHCQDAEILFSEAISYKMLNNIVSGAKKLKLDRYAKILTDIQNYHMNPITAGELAKEANVKKLVLVHITPYLPNENTEKMYLNGVKDVFDGEIILGKDKMKFNLGPK
ncbi:MAG: MBL fold metallo-hydrolase [Candidatus Lokiarchaeota archaeon]|nr:MBL fold metallo-hydrolase [Candidatus Lokiarchaeota archaeon]MBD3201797.1 MBL fold metallo-hydrolase [Candidatus Lokiarchaeota archaeon]